VIDWQRQKKMSSLDTLMDQGEGPGSSRRMKSRNRR
jgi:hypothetical protein